MNPPRARVAVTRDEGDDGPLSRALRDRGLEPARCPVVREADPEDAAPLRSAALDLEHFDWMVVASRRAVTAVMAARDGRPLSAALRTAAVGAASAAALRAAGAAEPLVAPEAGAAALAQALRGADRWRGRRVLLPRAAEGIAELGAVLRAEGAEVVEVIAYRTLARPAAEVARDWNQAAPGAAVFASPSAVHALAAGIGAPALRALRAVVAIGPTTAAALATLGITASVPATTGFEAAAALMRDLLDDTTANTTIRAAHAAGEEPNP